LTALGFDLCVRLTENNKDYTFSGIDRSDYTSLYNFLDSKGIRIQNLQAEEVAEVKTTFKEEEIFGPAGDDPMDEDDDSEDDESYGGADAARDEAKAKADVRGSSDEDSEDALDDDELGSEIDDKLDSDLEEARGKSKPVATKKSKPSESPASPDPKKRKKKDKNAPKRAMSGYMFFMTTNRERIKNENPDAEFKDIVSCCAPFRPIIIDRYVIFWFGLYRPRLPEQSGTRCPLRANKSTMTWQK
jgi:structure-specific recognition protein 1